MPKPSMLAAAALISALCLVPCAAIAGQDTLPPNPLDPAYPVPQLSHESVFTPYQTGEDAKETPDKRWLRANRESVPKDKAADEMPGAETKHHHHSMHGGH